MIPCSAALLAGDRLAFRRPERDGWHGATTNFAIQAFSGSHIHHSCPGGLVLVHFSACTWWERPLWWHFSKLVDKGPDPEHWATKFLFSKSRDLCCIFSVVYFTCYFSQGWTVTCKTDLESTAWKILMCEYSLTQKMYMGEQTWKS